MRGRAELIVVSHVEMQGEEAPHLQEIIRRLRDHGDRSSKGPILNELDKDLLTRFDHAMTEANEQALKELGRLRPTDEPEGGIPGWPDQP